jgi:hypothetical protein
MKCDLTTKFKLSVGIEIEILEPIKNAEPSIN